MRFLYSLITFLFMPMAFGHLLQRSRRQPEYRRHWGERLGLAPRLSGPILWLHAVSIGETRAAAPLIEALLQRHPDHRVLLTHTTPTGRTTGREMFAHHAGRVVQAYLPYDLPWAVALFLRRTQPSLGILMETEIWPNLYAAAARRNIPLFLVNARMSAKSAAGYARLGRLTRVTLQHLTAIAAQTKADAARLAELGGERITVCGNLKFEVSAPANTAARVAELRALFGARPVWLAASTREAEGESEEAMILDAWQRQGKSWSQEKSWSDPNFVANFVDPNFVTNFATPAVGATPCGCPDDMKNGQARGPAPTGIPARTYDKLGSDHDFVDFANFDAPAVGATPCGCPDDKLDDKLGSDPNFPLLVIVPRHPQRFDAVAAMLTARGVRFVRRSAGQPARPETQVVLGDSMGEMTAYFGAADVAFIGGSLLPLGGQNLIEAAAAGCPVLIGPHSFNFAAATETALAAGAALRVADADALVHEVSALLAEPERRAAMQSAGRAFAEQHRGATTRILALLVEMIA